MTEEDEREGGSPWKWAEVLFGGGVIVYLAGATFSGIWWAASLNKETMDISEHLISMEHRFDGLDNVSLGNRVTKLEVELQAFSDQQARMERKIDVLLERRYGSQSGPSQTHEQR